MMRFAAYYGFHYWLQFELAAYNVSRNLARFRFEPILLPLVKYRTAGLNLRPVRMPLWGPGPGPISLVLQKHPIA
jgi:hypothetical protein